MKTLVDPLLPNDLAPVLEERFLAFDPAAQSILERLLWEEQPPRPPRRIFVAKVYRYDLFWPALWRPNKATMLRYGFSVSKPDDDWRVTYSFIDSIAAAPAV